jgi:hypothetical protein
MLEIGYPPPFLRLALIQMLNDDVYVVTLALVSPWSPEIS